MHPISYWSVLLFFCASVLAKSVVRDETQDGELNLSHLLKSGKIDEARSLSQVDPSLFTGVRSHAGYFTVNETGKWNLFFWYFPAEGLPLESTPLVVWLQGGPGGSSLFGLFTEIGPIQVINGTVERRPITWNSNYSLLFIDNPVGTGFSYTEGTDYATDEDMVGGSLLSFIQQFLDVFVELRKAPLFLAGESYAGKYIPAFGHYIHNQNDSSRPINLKGLAIGDGWIDPPTMLHYSEWGLQVGLFDKEQANTIHEAEKTGRQYWKEQKMGEFEEALIEVWSLMAQYAPVDVYNYLKNEDTSISDEPFIAFLNQAHIQDALHVKKTEYNPLNRRVFWNLYEDRYRTIKPWLEELLEHYGVMCYSGQLDVIVAYALSVHTYRSLKWSGAKEYLAAQRIPIYDDEEELRVNSFVKSHGNFWDVMVRGAGHMVPTDKPRAAKQIIDLFIEAFKGSNKTLSV